MARSKTEICNLAVSWLAGNRITSLETDPSTEARLCRDNYDMSRKAVLEEREWTFAVKRATLSPLASTPDFGYNFQFLVPPDSLRVVHVSDPRTSNQRRPPSTIHAMEGRKLLADIESVNIRYIGDIEDVTQFSPLFDQALAAHIASNICIPLTENATQQELMFKLYDAKMQNAAASDGLQGSRELLEQSQLENTRRMFVRPV